MNNLIIGIAGGSGSGKTTLACRLKALFGEDEVRLISHDSYYKRHDELPFEERCKLNYDHPDAFDNALLIYHLQELKAGRAIDCPVYDLSLIHILVPKLYTAIAFDAGGVASGPMTATFLLPLAQGACVAAVSYTHLRGGRWR